jgi:hypothetical protein
MSSSSGPPIAAAVPGWQLFLGCRGSRRTALGRRR